MTSSCPVIYAIGYDYESMHLSDVCVAYPAVIYLAHITCTSATGDFDVSA